ncbi:MAG: hypothetical protein J6W00_12550 [Lentisphaeria bacterium]|nr:hypothetical protein [Lentisphaeria bacterium]
MKKIIVSILSVVAMFTASAGEREVLLKTFEKEYSGVVAVWQNAMTQIDLTAAAGNNWQVSESQLFRALDYKLRHTADAAERLKMLADFYHLSREVQKIYDTPRENMGSGAGMRIYGTIAFNMQQFIAVLMLDSESEKHWKKISEAELDLNGKKIKLSRGKATFDAVMYEQQVTLEIVLFPQNTFTHRGRDFAIIKTDIPFAGNDDFSKVYLCELKNGKLQVVVQLKMPYFEKWNLKRNKLTIFDSNNAKEEFIL